MSLLGPTRTTHPVHTRGEELLHGRLYRHGLWPATQASWLDEPGQDDVLVRLSRPDALCLRIPVGAARCGDLLLSHAGGLLARYVRGAARPPRALPLSTSLAYRTPTGDAVVLGARANGVESFELTCATEDGEVRVFADLRLSRRPVAGDVSFDPVRHRLPGLEPRAGAERARYLRSA